jgi:putative PLP-dependent aminotransferase (TIGR04422 family)
MIDYQWPHAELDKVSIFTGTNDPVKNRELYHQIESFFSNLFNVDVILMPSGRSAISALLKYYGLNRSHTVFAPKWTSHCVWDMITRLANPESVYSSTCNGAIVVHKWGNIEKLSQPANHIVIEDSVDSLILDTSTLFPNNGDFEIISLPKTIGSYTGGLILARNQQKASELRSFIRENTPLGVHQSGLRLLHTINK